MNTVAQPWVYRNGDWIPQSQAFIALNDFGFLQGATVTDLVRTIQGKAYLAMDHIIRFLETGEETGILPRGTISADGLFEVIENLISRNLPLAPSASELAVVMIATPGLAEHYLQNPSPQHTGPTLLVHSFPINRARYAPWFEAGARLTLVKSCQVPEDCYSPHWKVRSRLQWWLADQEARAKSPGSIALLRNQKGEVLETALAHILVVKNATLFSPPAGSILKGVTLNKVKSLAQTLGIPFQERSLTPEDLWEADEVLLTGTMVCLAGVSQLETRSIPWPGPMGKRLQDFWWNEIGHNLSNWFIKKP